ncbi:MAG: hypothetical protein Q7U34_04595 [Anaerolineales bacterium]|nr:hypothetical protein [Anaerolineales bacterium]MDP3184662.1 hypothetical protein [Anaerolineales bacterium]
MDPITRAVQEQLEKQSGLGPVEKAMALQQMQQGIEKFWVEADKMLEPYAPYLPLVIGALLVWLLETLLNFVAWLLPLLLSGIFPLLKAIGVTHEVAEAQEVRRLVLD